MKKAILSLALGLALGANTNLLAQSRTWTGLGADNVFSNPANWGTAPVSGVNSVTFAGSTRTSPDLTAPFTVFNTTTTTNTGAVLFAAGASSFTLGSSTSSTLTLNSSLPSGFYSGIINFSGNLQTINANINVTSSGARASIGSSGGGNLSLGGTLTATAGIDFSSSSVATTTVAAVAGAGAINVNASVGTNGTTVLNSATGYSGTVSVNAGTLILGSDLGGAGGTTVGLGGGNTSALFLKGGVTLDNAISVAPSAATTKQLGMAGGETGAAVFGGNVGNSDADTTRLFLTTDTGALASFTGIVDFTRPIEKVGAGSVSLTGVNTGTGGLKVSQGTLFVSADRNMGAVANTVELAGGTLAFTNASALTTDVSRGLSVSTNSAIVLGSAANVTWSGNLTGSANLAVTGTTNARNLILSGNNAAYTGSYTVGSLARLQVGSSSVTSTNNVSLVDSGTLVVNVGGTTTMGNLSGGAASGAVQAQASAGSATLVVNQTTNASLAAPMRDNASGILNFTKAGAATLTLSGGTGTTNTYTGLTTVSAGTLNLNKTAGITAIAGNINLSSGATLLISSSDQVADTSAVTLAGGTIQRGGDITETFGNLTLTTASFLNFGTGSASSLNFGTYSGGGFKLNVNNFLAGNVLTFKTDLSTSITNTSLFGFDNAFTSSWSEGTGTFTITAVPEPSSVLAATGLVIALSLGNWMTRRGKREP